MSDPIVTQLYTYFLEPAAPAADYGGVAHYSQVS